MRRVWRDDGGGTMPRCEIRSVRALRALRANPDASERHTDIVPMFPSKQQHCGWTKPGDWEYGTWRQRLAKYDRGRKGALAEFKLEYTGPALVFLTNTLPITGRNMSA